LSSAMHVGNSRRLLLALTSGALTVVAVAAGITVASASPDQPITPSAAPPAAASVYAVITVLPTPERMTYLALANGGDADPRDDTLFGGRDDLYVFPPLSTSASTPIRINVPGDIRAMATDSTKLYLGTNSVPALFTYPLSVASLIAADDSTALTFEPKEIAVDDSVYVIYYNNRRGVDIFDRRLASSVYVPFAGNPQGSTALALSDDSLYATAWEGNNGYATQLNLVNTDDSVTFRPSPPRGATSVAAIGERVIVGFDSGNAISLNARNWDDSAALAFIANRVALSGSTAWATDAAADKVRIAIAPTFVVQQELNLPVPSWFEGSLVVGSDGVGYISLEPNGVAVVAPVSASLSTDNGVVGSTIQVALTLPTYRIMDDSTVTEVWWGDDTVAFTNVSGSNAVSVTVPEGTGSVALTLGLRGGGAVTAGTFTYGGNPAPMPVPASAPLDVTAVAGDGSAVVSWAVPASSGSFAISTYQVQSTPDGRVCLVAVPATSCEVAQLTNGTDYTFEVRALTGAGWSAWSQPSVTVTPAPAEVASILISGTRGEVRGGSGIVVTGATTGLGMGAIVRPWVRLPGQTTFTQGPARILVDESGEFTWQRRVGKKVTVYVETPDGTVRSKRITIPR